MDSPFRQLPPDAPDEVRQAHTHLECNRGGGNFILAREVKRGSDSSRGV